MALKKMTPMGYAKATGVGIITSLILSMIMIPALKAGIVPISKPLDLAFAQMLMGEVSISVGIILHMAYLTFWSVVYISIFKRQTFLNALWLALGLWIAVLFFFFPIVGWGVCGLSVSPKLVMASLLPHVLYALILWGLCRWFFQDLGQDY